jgi:hypothetical protein
MGIAAYNRGNLAISRDLFPERYREPAKPTPRPSSWGNKAAQRATERARRIVAGLQRYGLTVVREQVIGAVVERERIAVATATTAVDAVLQEIAP